jgi:hypothetical protein
VKARVAAHRSGEQAIGVHGQRADADPLLIARDRAPAPRAAADGAIAPAEGERARSKHQLEALLLCWKRTSAPVLDRILDHGDPSPDVVSNGLKDMPFRRENETRVL